MQNTRTEDLRAELQEWLCAYLTAELRLPAGSIDPAEPMSAYGLDSIRAINLLVDIEAHVGFEIDPNALWEFPTVAAFTDLLVGRLTEPARLTGTERSPLG